MASVRFITAAVWLLIATTCTTSHPSGSPVDQYPPRQSHPALLAGEATDRPARTGKSFQHQRSGLAENTKHGAQLVAHHSLIGKDFITDKQTKRTRSRRDIDNNTRLHKRSFYPWSSSNSIQPQIQSIDVWKPAGYQLNRPYYVPVFGAAGRIPVYYPPQPLYLNPGTPQVNPAPPYQGPTYLPPVVTQKPNVTNATLDNRFNNDGYDGKPIWGVVTEPSNIPTRATLRPGMQTVAPPLQHGGDNQANSNQPSKEGPEAPPKTDGGKPGLPNCVRAIISCCSETSEIRYNCFEQLGCTGAFWGTSPCDGDFAEAAIDAALKYYET